MLQLLAYNEAMKGWTQVLYNMLASTEKSVQKLQCIRQNGTFTDLPLYSKEKKIQHLVEICISVIPSSGLEWTAEICHFQL
jgi:hypothetical protein